MLHIFTFDGKSSLDFGVATSGEETWVKPAPVMERTSVPGRNGDIVTFTGGYENVSITYKCGITRNFSANYAAFLNYLLSIQGYRRLEDSRHPDYYRMALLESVGTLSPTRFYRAGEFSVTFNCKPQTFLRSGELKRTYTSDGTIYNPTLFDAKPLLRVYGTGEFTIGHDTVTISEADEYTDLDCESENAYKDDCSTNCNGNITLSGDDFPVIPSGQVGIALGTGITKIEITPRWWQL